VDKKRGWTGTKHKTKLHTLKNHHSKNQHHIRIRIRIRIMFIIDTKFNLHTVPFKSMLVYLIIPLCIPETFLHPPFLISHSHFVSSPPTIVTFPVLFLRLSPLQPIPHCTTSHFTLHRRDTDLVGEISISVASPNLVPSPSPSPSSFMAILFPFFLSSFLRV